MKVKIRITICLKMPVFVRAFFLGGFTQSSQSFHAELAKVLRKVRRGARVAFVEVVDWVRQFIAPFARFFFPFA